MSAKQLLQTADHPLHSVFTRWLRGKTATLRQARKFLATYPQFKRGAING